MIQALMAGVSSIQAQQTRMDVIGNDLANINTTAYKGGDVTFEDMISQQVQGASAPSGGLGGTNPVQYGLGVRVAGTTTNESQGSLSATNNPTDLAIQGNGFFMVSDGNQISYTRDGSFSVDQSGNVVNSSTGQKLLGWTADTTGAIDFKNQVTKASSLTIPVGSLTAAQATNQMSLGGTLDASALSTDTALATTTVYDSLGASHDITVQFSNPQTTPTSSWPAGATTSWDWSAYAGDAATGTAISGSATTGNSPLYFDASGAPISGLAAGVTNTITVPATANGKATVIGMNVTGLDQLGSGSSVSVTNQNGFPPGSLDNYSVNGAGVITGTFTNGLTRPLGQIALATFANPAGLSSSGSNLFQGSLNSGLPDVAAANTSGHGSINPGFLEQSNVDLSRDLTNLIVTQRGFESNTKIVTTVDQLLQSVLDMKR